MILLEGDVFFAAPLLDQLLASSNPDVTLVERWTPALDGSVVQVAADGTVAAWVHKKDRPPGIALEGCYKTVNIHRFSAAFVRGRICGRHWRRRCCYQGDHLGEPISRPCSPAILRDGARIHGVQGGPRPLGGNRR